MTELLASKRVKESAAIRRDCIDKMTKFIKEHAVAAVSRGESGEVVVVHYLFIMTFNLVGNLLLSKDLMNSQSKDGVEFFEAMGKITVLTAKPNASDLWLFFKRLDPQRIKKNMEKEMGRTIKIVEKFVSERMEERKSTSKTGKKDFLDALLEYEGEGKMDLIRSQNKL